MRKSLLTCLLLFSCLVLNGCATIINGTTQKIPVNTSPQGAIAKNQDGVQCTTPCSLELKRKDEHIIQISKDGFEDVAITCQRVLSGAVAGNILLGGLIGGGVDAASGSMYRLTPESITVDLKPLVAKIEKPGFPIEKLKELEELKKSGTITEDEYIKLRAKVVDDIGQK